MRRIPLLNTVALVVLALAAGPAWASDYTVTTSADSGEGSLRAAIDAANGTPGEDEITFVPSLSGQTIALASDLPTITDAAGLTIDGSGADITVKGEAFDKEGNPYSLRVFQVGNGAKLAVNEIAVDWGLMPLNGGTLTVSDSTFSRVSVSGEGGGSEVTLDKLKLDAGAIETNGGTLTVSDATLSAAWVQVGNGAEATLDKLTLTAYVSDDEESAIANYGGTLTVRDSNISGNKVSVPGGDSGDDGDGGATYNEGGTLTVSRSTFSRNFAADNGGAIYSKSGTLTVRDSTFHLNRSNPGLGFDPEYVCLSCGGGGIYNGGAATVSRSTFFGNQSMLGGGILNHGRLTVTNSTLSGDDLHNFTGLDYFGQLAVSDSTIGGLVNDPGGSATLDNTIVAGGCDEFGGTVTDGGYNLDPGTRCGFGTDNSSLSGRDPKLAPLADNGGPTRTRALLPGSPALNAIPEGVNGCGITVTTDQRGVKRLQGGACEIGSFEDRSPRVKRVVPANGATDIAVRANVRAHISEGVKPNSVNANTVKLFRAGTSTPLAAQVSYDAEKKKAVLNPDNDLQRGARYRAVVTTGVKDLVGNRLDQNRSEAGNQRKVWFFTVRR